MNKLTYKQAGVDIEAGAELVSRIKPLAAATRTRGVLSGLGGFGSLFELPVNDYIHPVLVSGTDGVGTKLKLAIELNRHDTVGIDLVAMCANDILCSGALPLFFLDYYASGRLNLEVATSVITGIAEGCKRAGCALTGGETAEMPGMYNTDDYDLAGFCVGIVEKDCIPSPDRVNTGDVLIGLASSGPHSNGYSLIRKILETTDLDFALAAQLMAPTKIYVKSVHPLTRVIQIHGMAHITGGGITENLPRILPPGTNAVIDLDSWDRPEVFDWIQEEGNVSDDEMLKTFNCGVGMILCVSAKDSAWVLNRLVEAGEEAWPIGYVNQGVGDPVVEYFRD